MKTSILNKSWKPELRFVLLSFFFVRLLSALFSPSFLSDCDEVMNYWEPLHYLLYGNGFQTWEYSPTYGLRSYAYILIYAIFGKFFSFFTSNKIVVFYLIRIVLAVVSSICDTFFYHAISEKFTIPISRISFIFMLLSPGLFFSSTTFLPSTFSMYSLTLAFGFWFLGNYKNSIICVACGTLIGWPFCVIVTIPLALDCLYNLGFPKVLFWGYFSLIIFLVPSIIIDYYYYHKFVLAVGNIILYNVFSSSGANIYGVEPWTFYFLNCFLNFNFIFILALFCFPILFLHFFGGSFNWRLFMYLSPFYIWFFIMTLMAHKEERFLFPIYPLICLCGAVSFCILQDTCSVFVGKMFKRIRFISLRRIIEVPFFLLFVVILLLNISRIMSVFLNYRAPISVYTYLSGTELPRTYLNLKPAQKVIICVGKEWYRFPSNFFLPSSDFELNFIKSGFDGQLPKHFSPETQTWGIPTEMNDKNLEEFSRYINISQCDYLIDFDIPSQREPHYFMQSEWKLIYQVPFLDNQRSHPLFRAFFIPYFSVKFNVYGAYQILKRKG